MMIITNRISKEQSLRQVNASRPVSYLYCLSFCYHVFASLHYNRPSQPDSGFPPWDSVPSKLHLPSTESDVHLTFSFSRSQALLTLSPTSSLWLDMPNIQAVPLAARSSSNDSTLLVHAQCSAKWRLADVDAGSRSQEVSPSWLDNGQLHRQRSRSIPNLKNAMFLYLEQLCHVSFIMIFFSRSHPSQADF